MAFPAVMMVDRRQQCAFINVRPSLDSFSFIPFQVAAGSRGRRGRQRHLRNAPRLRFMVASYFG